MSPDGFFHSSINHCHHKWPIRDCFKHVSGVYFAKLKPQLLCDVHAILQVLSDGVLVSFGGFFHGSIDHCHLGTPIPEQDWAKR